MLLFFAKSIFKLFELLAKVCAYLLVKVGLWVPVVFVFCAVIFCAVSGIALDETALDIILAGIIITSALSIWLTALLNKSVRDAKKKKQVQESPKSKIKKGRKNDFISQSQDLEYEQEFVHAKKNQIMPQIEENQNQAISKQQNQFQSPYQYNQNMADGMNTYNPQWSVQNGYMYPPQQMQQGQQYPQVAGQNGYGYPQQGQNTNQTPFIGQGNEPYGATFVPQQNQMQYPQGQVPVSQQPQQGQVSMQQDQCSQQVQQSQMSVQNSSGIFQNGNAQGGYGECGSACQNGYGTRPQNANVTSARESSYLKNNESNSGMRARDSMQMPQSVYNYEEQKRNQGFYDKYLPSYEARKASSGKPVFDESQSFNENNIANKNFTSSGNYSGENSMNNAAPQHDMNLKLLDNVGREEKPIVFATRKDPNIFIAEYSDRLEFYRKTKNGMKFLSTEYKTKN